MRDRDRLVTALGAELHALIVASRAFTAQSIEDFEPPVSGAAFAVLGWLHVFGPARSSAVAEGLAMDRSIVSRLLKQLGRQLLVEAQPDGTDGRAVVYALSKTGREKVAAATGRKGIAFERRLQNWSDADLVLLTELLRRLVEGSESSRDP